jgi:hypothetical protein
VTPLASTIPPTNPAREVIDMTDELPHHHQSTPMSPAYSATRSINHVPIRQPNQYPVQHIQQPLVPQHHTYPPLPPAATPENWNREYIAALGTIPTSHAQVNRRARAHSLMIASIYGVDALVPCNQCLSLGLTCRVYHPSVESPQWRAYNRNLSLGLSCSRCRFRSYPGGCCAR